MHRPEFPVLRTACVSASGSPLQYQFKTAGIAKDRNRIALLIDFASLDRRSNAELGPRPGAIETAP